MDIRWAAAGPEDHSSRPLALAVGVVQALAWARRSGCFGHALPCRGAGLPATAQHSTAAPGLLSPSATVAAAAHSCTIKCSWALRLPACLMGQSKHEAQAHAAAMFVCKRASCSAL